VRSFTVGFVAALVVVLWVRPDFAIGFTLLAVSGLLILRLLSREPRWIVVGLFAGAMVAQTTIFLQLNRQLAPGTIKIDVAIVGTVISVPKHDDRHSSFLFRVDEYENNAQRPTQVRLSWYGGARKSIMAGDQWRLVARLKPTTSLGNPGGFNYERWLFQNRIHATGYVRDEPKPQRLSVHPNQLHALRERLAKQISDLPSANAHAPLIQGLTVGVTNNISVEQWQTLRESGTAHLLAISGLHIGLVAGWVYAFAGLMWRLVHYSQHYSNRSLGIKPIFTLGMSCTGALVYAALAGFSLPTQRALVMLCVFALTVLLRRVWPPGTALILALLMVLLLDPLAVLSVGFWLSFGTVSVLFYLHNGRLNKVGPKSGALFLHLKLGLVLLPATAWFFQQGSLVAPVANAVAVPVVGLFVVPASFIIALLTPWWPTGASALLTANQWVLEKLLLWLDWLLALPASSLPLFLPGPLVLLCVLSGLLLLFVPRGLRLRWLAIPLIAPAIALNLLGRPVRGLELHVLDVGQGLATILLTENHTVLFDTGKRISDSVTMFDRVVRPFLVSQGRSDIDVSVLSHADDDHAGGIKSLLDYYPHTRLYSSDEQHQLEANAQACVAGKTFELDEVRFSFIHPGEADIGTTNNLSCVLLVQYGYTRILLTGDIEAESERLLLERMGEPLPLSVLVAPHHGSRSSSTRAFVSMLPSDTVIFAAGENNKFGFPHPEVVDRYRESGSRLFTTGKHGAVFLQFDQNGIAAPITWFWHNRRRYRR